jgi:histidinol dehydrogenase
MLEPTRYSGPSDERLARIRSRVVGADPALIDRVEAILGEVRRRGDAAVADYTERFDCV